MIEIQPHSAVEHTVYITKSVILRYRWSGSKRVLACFSTSWSGGRFTFPFVCNFTYLLKCSFQSISKKHIVVFIDQRDGEKEDVTMLKKMDVQ